MHCNVCNKYRTFKKLKLHIFRKIFKEEESIEILRIIF